MSMTRFLDERDGESLTRRVDRALAEAGEDDANAAAAAGRARLQAEDEDW